MLPTSPEEAPERKRPRTEDAGQACFMEIFAGKGVLTKEVQKYGIRCEPPNDLASGGTDFRDPKQVENLKDLAMERLKSTRYLVIHLAPPCASFSRARDRSYKTRLRSSIYPEGLPGKGGQTKEPNKIAKRAYRFACWAADELGAMVSMENRRRAICGTWLTRRGRRRVTMWT